MEYQVSSRQAGGCAMTRGPDLSHTASGGASRGGDQEPVGWGVGQPIVRIGGGDQEVGPERTDLEILKLECPASELEGASGDGIKSPVAQLGFWCSPISGVRDQGQWGGSAAGAGQELGKRPPGSVPGGQPLDVRRNQFDEVESPTNAGGHEGR